MRNKCSEFFNKLFPETRRDTWHMQRKILGVKFVHRTDVPFNKDIEYFNNLTVQNNKIVFFTDSCAYTCNPKYIAQEIIRRHLPYELVWVVNKNILKYIKDFPKEIKLVMTGTTEEIDALGTAKILVNNERRSRFLKRGYNKKHGQINIQTWHGSLGIKCTSNERHDLSKRWQINNEKDNSQIDYLISNGQYDTAFFKRVFENNGEIKEFGHPRNDIFFKTNIKIKQKVYKALDIPESKKIALYAPTFREDRDLSPYTLDYNRLKSGLEAKFGGEWVVVNRLHPRLTNLKHLCAQYGHVIDATDYSDMQELLAAVDVCITDYSSCIYDFILQYKPGFIYAVDAEKYDKGRGLQYPLSQTPFLIATNNDEMVKNIENFDLETYKAKVKEFLDNKGCIDDGHAAARTVDLIEKLMSEE